MLRTRGFTLIELLIVVAIIAILAAIAIPNFIEAQVRAKVSCAKADMRSIATALEAYRLDNRDYPPDLMWYQLLYGGYQSGAWTLTLSHELLALHVVTTPIAYMSSVPNDAFENRVKSTVVSTFWRDMPLTAGRRKYFDYAQKFSWQTTYSGTPNFNVWVGRYGRKPSVVAVWSLCSIGPDQMNNSSSGAGFLFGEEWAAFRSHTYDASNGSKSAGDVARTGP